MISYLLRRYPKSKRSQVVGQICGAVSLFFNLLLALTKLALGWLSGSVSVSADGINNLSDVGTSLVNLVAFYIAKKPADQEHPYGHERFEFLGALWVSLTLLFLAYVTAKQAINSLIVPSELKINLVGYIALVLSILVKGYMYCYDHHYGNRYHSPLLLAGAKDSLSDAVSTTIVLIGLLIPGYNLDAWLGLGLAFLLGFNALKLAKETIDDLLGKAPDPSLLQQLKYHIQQDPYVLGVHDCLIHQYGLNHLFASAHVEVDAQCDFLLVHDAIDQIEREVKEKMGIDLVLHMDPISIHDEKIAYYAKAIGKAIDLIDPSWTFHDLRIVTGPTHTNVVFDLVIGYDERRSSQQLGELLLTKCDFDHLVYFVIQIDRA